MVRQVLRDSPSAWLVQFYSSSCGHCVSFAPTWRALAGDVHEWDPAIRVGVLDCGDEENYGTCKEYGIPYYPTFRYFRAFTRQFTTGESRLGADREPQTVRQTMIDFLQNHSREAKPPACPPLEPMQPEDIFALFDKNLLHYTAVIFEKTDSYVGREVILDLSQYENIVVKRVSGADAVFLEKLNIPSVPSTYLIYPNGSHGFIPISKLYMADLESGLHYLLRVELATHKTLEGAELKTFKDVVILLAKLFPGQQPVMKLLETLEVWLVSLPLDKIPYDAILDLLNNKMRISGLFLTNRIQWVGCQGSRPELRGYTCSFWKLFHTLTVQAALRPKALLNTGLEDSPQAVLRTMERCIQSFFGCRDCAQHFAEMARESLSSLKTLDEAVLWLWEKHNVVNARVAGDLSEDPKFPKVQWPTPDICPACHEEIKGAHAWNKDQVLQFLKHHYSSDNIVYTYTEGQAHPGEGVLQEEQEKSQLRKEGQRNEEKLQDPQTLLVAGPRVVDRWMGQDSPVKDRGKKGAESVVQEDMKQAVSFLGVGFSNVDMSLCIVLYIASANVFVPDARDAASRLHRMAPPIQHTLGTPCSAPPPGTESDVSDCEQQSFINSDSSDDEFYGFNEN
ncbi:Sulfhydryl oxidase 2 [Varanus komodoensis]|nr:Sulfhydryl oxidase 2 [Varanus komodoensis]